MCLLDTNIHEKILDSDNIRLNKTELNKLLIKIKYKYSDQLVDLLRCILEYDPQKRITFSALIDMMHPLLTSNIQRVQNIYGNNNDISSLKDEETFELIKKISEI